jgi:glycosyltransferase involved in cell wall biosynthesis
VSSPSIRGTRICLATPLFYPSHGGSQLRYKRYLPGLRELGADVRVFAGTATPLDFTPEDDYRRWSEFRLGRMLPAESLEGTPVHRVRLPDGKGLVHRTIYHHALWRYCRNPETRPDVLQLVGTIRWGAIPWILQHKRMGIAPVYAVTTASKVTRRVEGFDRRLFKFRSIFNSMARKGSDLLVEAFSRLARIHPDAHLVFVGPRPAGGEAHHHSFRDRMDRLVDQSGAAERIHFIGISDEVPEYLRAADVFVLPSKREGLPNSVIEAMACRTPVVITPFDGLCDDLGKADSEYLLADFDPACLALRIQRLIEEKPLAEAIARNGQALIHRSMSLEASVARYKELYAELAALRCG